MAGPTLEGQSPTTPERREVNGYESVNAAGQYHRFSSHLALESRGFDNAASPSQLKRTIEAHLQETDRRLQETQQLGTDLLKQREDLNSKLEEVEKLQDEATIPADLRTRLADIEREHADVGKEVARALIGPKAKQEEAYSSDSGIFTSQATGSPTKVSAPSRRHRNQPSTRAGDLQFAADISTSLLAQVRQLQAAVAERDETLKRTQAEREVLEHDIIGYTQKIRALDESEQKYKDENWNLETERHNLLNATRDASDKEKRLNAHLSSALSEKTKLQNDLDELKLAHSKLAEEHSATRKAHDTEIHGLKRNVDAAVTDRESLQDKLQELIAQNQELAKAVATRSRSRQISPNPAFLDVPDVAPERPESPEDSPPPSPTKGTPRHGGLESETLKSSLTHAHRMIQNLKNNIHREKTEKIELKRMLQDARDDLEHRRGGDNSAAKRQKIKQDAFKKPARPDMLGSSRRARTDVELTDDDWEDQSLDSLGHARPATLQIPLHDAQRLTDLSDAYQTANDTEGTFDTADERNTTESEAFMTGAESLASDSTDELTETEDGASRSGHQAPGRVTRSMRQPNSQSQFSGAAAMQEMEDMRTPVQPSFTRFKLRSDRSSQNTPDSTSRSESLVGDSPATVLTSQSPPVGEQSLFAELGGMDEINSDTHSTPARSSTMSSTHSTPGLLYTPSKIATSQFTAEAKPKMIDSSTMTEDLSTKSEIVSDYHETEKPLLPAAFPLPPSVPASPEKRSDHSTQYTPQRNLMDSPVRPTSSHITPPRTIWDEAHESPDRSVVTADELPTPAEFAYSGVLAQDSLPVNSPPPKMTHYQQEIDRLQAQLSSREGEINNLGSNHAAALRAMRQELSELKNQHRSELEKTYTQAFRHQQQQIDLRQVEYGAERKVLTSRIAGLEAELSQLASSHNTMTANLRAQISALESSCLTKDKELESVQKMHAQNVESSRRGLEELKGVHAGELQKLEDELQIHQRDLSAKHDELERVHAIHAAALAASAAEIEALRESHASHVRDLDRRLNDHQALHDSAKNELDVAKSHQASILSAHAEELAVLHKTHETETRRVNEELDRHAKSVSQKNVEFERLSSEHSAAMAQLQTELDDVHSNHTAEVTRLKQQLNASAEENERKRADVEHLRTTHADELENLKQQLSGHDQELGSRRTELEKLRNIHTTETDGLRRQITSHKDEADMHKNNLQTLQQMHATDIERLRDQVSSQNSEIGSKHSELEALRLAHMDELNQLREHISSQKAEIDDHIVRINSLENKNTAHTNQAKNDQLKLEALSTQLAVQTENHRQAQSEVGALKTQVAGYAGELSARKTEIASSHKAHLEELTGLKDQLRATKNKVQSKQDEMEESHRQHAQHLEQLSAEMASNAAIIEGLRKEHEAQMNSLRQQLVAKDGEIDRLIQALQALKEDQAKLSGGYSAIMSQETLPASSPHTARQARLETNGPRTADKVPVSGAVAGMAPGVLSSVQPMQIHEDATSAPVHFQTTITPLNEVPDNSLNRGDDVFGGPLLRPGLPHDRSSQTSLTGHQVEKAPKLKSAIIAPVPIQNPPRSPSSRSPTRYPGRPSSRSRNVSTIAEDSVAGPSSPPARPGSAGSVRTSSFLSQNYPPLPSDHRDVIAKASSNVGSPTRKEAMVAKHGGVMGPPIMPASAMRRPKTPTESVRTVERIGKRGTASSRVSRRSSVSSFASELDERFNIRADQHNGTFEAGPGTDPRMIQAITQTMIGEFLWKYTRKAGSKEMSATRHRRYFWVHPYTKTLYWSDQDPQTAGGSQLKAKSVQIQSVRVVSDDNPMPPGLHRKSLEVITPGRKIKFTASTGQRHETWFNALSYLLHRSGDHEFTAEDKTKGDDITQEDIAEFNVNGYGARLVPNDSRMSMSSYNSRTTNNTQRRVRQSLPIGSALASANSEPPQSSTIQPVNNNTLRASRLEPVPDKDRTLRASSRSRISKMFGSVTGKHRSDAPGAVDPASQARENSSIYDASVVSDNHQQEEEARKQQQEAERPGLEDVRACCDGKCH